jgi:PTS system sucrose-specific IIC component
MRFFKPFVAGMVGGAVGSIFGAISGIGATAYGVTGIPGYLTINNPLVYTILLLISGGVAFAGTWMFWHEDEPDQKKVEKEIKEEKADTPAKEAFDQIPVITCKAGEVLQPVKGSFVKQEDIPDETFAAGVLGAGLGIEPEDETVFAPCDGEISSVAESKHAIGVTGPNDMEILIHVGVDTVAMNGEGFEPLVKEGDHVTKGQPILHFSKEKIKAAGHPDVVVVLLTNSDDFEDVSVKA